MSEIEAQVIDITDLDDAVINLTDNDIKWISPMVRIANQLCISFRNCSETCCNRSFLGPLRASY